IELCWQQQAQDRPSMTKVKTLFEGPSEIREPVKAVQKGPLRGVKSEGMPQGVTSVSQVASGFFKPEAKITPKASPPNRVIPKTPLPPTPKNRPIADKAVGAQVVSSQVSGVDSDFLKPASKPKPTGVKLPVVPLGKQPPAKIGFGKK